MFLLFDGHHIAAVIENHTPRAGCTLVNGGDVF
jgi:hypothetical protein